MLKLKRLKVLHYRNVAPGCELRFDDGINLVLGQNASGKTTLLALISAVCRSSFAGIKDEEFELEYEIESERFSIAVEISHRRRPLLEEDALLGAGPTWKDHYKVHVLDRVHRQPLTFDSLLLEEQHGVDPFIEKHHGIDPFIEWSFVAALLSLASAEHAQWREMRDHVLSSFTSAFRFDESLDCFAAVTGRESTLRGAASPPIARASLSIRRARSQTTAGSFLPPGGAFLLGLPWPGEQGLPPIVGHESMPLKAKLARHLGVAQSAIHANIREQRISGDERTYQIEGFTFQITRPDGTTIHHDRLSYGQKRLLAFLYYLECNPAVVIADELVNGLHHRWIDACMNELGERQAFLTSQNPLLFDYATFDSVERVQSSFLICGLELRDGREEMVWRNMSRDDAQVFFDAYQAGVEHVGDILITRGLW